MDRPATGDDVLLKRVLPDGTVKWVTGAWFGSGGWYSDLEGPLGDVAIAAWMELPPV